MDEHGATKRILSIDDDPEIRGLISGVLARAGWEVVTAADGPSGLRAAREQCPDLILLDIMMPGMNGYAVCDDLQIDPRTSHIPVVFLTALDDPRDRARALSLGGTDYLVKPFDPRTVAECVARNLNVALRFGQIAETHGPDAKSGDEAARSAADSPAGVPANDDFMRFKPFLLSRLPDIDRVRAVVERMRPADMYSKVASAGIDATDLAAGIAAFLGIERMDVIAPDSIAIGVLPAPLCRSSLVVPLETAAGLAFAVSNPFDRELVETLRSVVRGEPALIVAEPRVVLSVLGATRTEPAPATVLAPGAPAPAVPLAILAVDDDADALAVTVRMLESAGHRVWSAPEGATALVQLARRRFDVVLADIAMPTLGGFALLEIMRSQNIDVPVVFVTGSASPEDETAATRMGAVAFVHKPVERTALLGAIDRAR
jgi:CheY-like chemotaxis protein